MIATPLGPQDTPLRSFCGDATGHIYYRLDGKTASSLKADDARTGSVSFAHLPGPSLSFQPACRSFPNTP